MFWYTSMYAHSFSQLQLKLSFVVKLGLYIYFNDVCAMKLPLQYFKRVRKLWKILHLDCLYKGLLSKALAATQCFILAPLENSIAKNILNGFYSVQVLRGNYPFAQVRVRWIAWHLFHDVVSSSTWAECKEVHLMNCTALFLWESHRYHAQISIFIMHCYASE